MADSTWARLTAGLDDDDLTKLTAFREFCGSLPDVQERVHSADITFARRRSFASAYIKSHYLELGIELTRAADDPEPRTSFPTTTRFVMNRYSLREPADFDGRIRALIREAWDTVGPGSR